MNADAIETAPKTPYADALAEKNAAAQKALSELLRHMDGVPDELSDQEAFGVARVLLGHLADRPCRRKLHPEFNASLMSEHQRRYAGLLEGQVGAIASLSYVLLHKVFNK